MAARRRVLIYHDVSTGAGDDLAKATEIARSMVVRFGMDKKVGQVAYEHEAAPLLEVPGGGDWRPRHYGESTAGDIDAAVRALTDESFQRAVVILTANRALLRPVSKRTARKGNLLGRGSGADFCQARGCRRRNRRQTRGSHGVMTGLGPMTHLSAAESPVPRHPVPMR